MPLLAAPVLAAIIGGGASIAGGVLANKGSQSQTQASTPTIDPKYAGLQDLVLQSIQKRLSTPIDTAGYTGSGIANINRAYDLTKASQDNNLTARGLGTSPVAGAVDATRENARGGQIAQFQNSIPMLVDSMQRERLGDASSVLGMGRGVSSTGTGTESGGGGAAGAFGSLASYLGYLQGRGAFGGSAKSPLGARPTVPNVGFLPAGGTGY